MQRAILAKLPLILLFALPIVLLINQDCTAQEVSYTQDASRIAEEIARQKEQEKQKTLHLIDSLYQSGKRYYKQGEYQKAQDAFKSVLELDPKNLNAAKYIEESAKKLEEQNKKKAQQQRITQLEAARQKTSQQESLEQKAQPPITAVSAKKQGEQKSADIKAILLKEAKNSFKNKDYDTAVRDFEALLAMEAGNKEIENWLLKAKTEQIKAGIQHQAQLVEYDQQVSGTKKQLQENIMMLEVENAYIPKEKPKVSAQEVEEAISPEEEEAFEAKRRLKENLSKIKVPALDIKEADIRDFIRQLITMTGVNIILDEKALAKASEGKPYLKITFSTVSELSLIDLLDIALKTTDLTYKIEPNYIWISDRVSLEKEKLVTKTYKLKYGVRKIRKVQLKEFEPKTYKIE